MANKLIHRLARRWIFFSPKSEPETAGEMTIKNSPAFNYRMSLQPSKIELHAAIAFPNQN